MKVCVFCGSSFGKDARYRRTAEEVGRLLARQGHGLVYGGGNVGLMGVVADAVLGAGGEAVGVIPELLARKEVAHAGLTKLHVVRNMHTRKDKMISLSDAFLVLPGGYGTLDELFEAVTWSQLGIHRKPVGLVNTAGYFDALLAWVDKAVAEGFVLARSRELIIVEERPAALLKRLTP